MSAPAHPQYAPDSRCCAAALQNTLLSTSLDVGWTSCVLDHVEGVHSTDLHETHPTPDLTVVVATRGEHDVDVLRDGRWLSAVYQTGSVGLTPGGETTRLKWRNRRADTPFRTAHLYVPQAFLREAAELLRRPGQDVSEDVTSILVVDECVAVSTVSSLLTAMTHGEPDLFAETALRWLSLHLLSRFGERGGRRRSLNPAIVLSDPRLARAIEFMTANLSRPISVADIAQEAGVSPFHFARLFARRVGMPPHAYLARARMQKAETLLATTDLPVAVVASECGFSTPASFSFAFTRHSGKSPSTFPRRIRRQK